MHFDDADYNVQRRPACGLVGGTHTSPLVISSLPSTQDQRPMPIILNMSAIPGIPAGPPTPPNPPRPPRPPMDDIMPKDVDVHVIVPNKIKKNLTLHFFHIHLVASLTLHHRFHHFLHASTAPHLPLHLL
jgi:hypothetical protein